MGIGFHISPEEVTGSHAPEGSGGERAGDSERRRTTLWITALAIFAFFAALFPASKALLWDEAVYLSTAENLGKATPYYSEIASRPPLLPVLLRIGGSVMRMETFARALEAGFFAAGVVVLYLLGRRLFGQTSGLTAAALMALCPFFLHFAHKVMAEVPAAVLASASMLCFFGLAREEDDEPHGRLAIAAGILLAAAILMRFELGVLAIVPIYLGLMNRVGFRPILIALGSAAATLLPYLGWAQFRLGGFWKPLFAGDVGGGGDAVYYLRTVWMIAGPLVLAGIALYLAPMGRRTGDIAGRDIPLLAWFGLVFVCLAASQPKEPRFLAPAFPVLFLYAGAGYARCNRKHLAGFAVVVALIAGGFEVERRAYFSGSLDMGETQLLSYAQR
ncbi:MAG TPA: glycosyltransferase family 39 protein, partial [Terriglobia bacterium]|nr:glycosyltransferase family 39 protein [Terriglobia bacterium]